MRVKSFLAVSVGMLMAVSAFAMKEVKGLAWLEMSPDDRLEVIRRQARDLKREYRVRLSDEPEIFYDIIYKKLLANHNLYTESVRKIFADYLYENDPKVRDAVDKQRAKQNA